MTLRKVYEEVSHLQDWSGQFLLNWVALCWRLTNKSLKLAPKNLPYLSTGQWFSLESTSCAQWSHHHIANLTHPDGPVEVVVVDNDAQ